MKLDQGTITISILYQTPRIQPSE